MNNTRELGKILVTGADGFIGSHLVETLLTTGHEVTALCLYNSLGSFGWLNHLAINSPANLRLVLGDVRDQRMMDNLVKSHKTVFHLASLIAIPYSYLAPESYVDTNIKGGLNIALACLKNDIERLVHTSTSEVYGTAKFVPITEDHPLQGQSPYSASKIGADMLVNSFWTSFNLPVITLRPFNTYGPRQSMRAVIPTIIAQALHRKKEIHLGSITPTRDFNYVSDTVNAFMAVAKSKSEALFGQTYNAGSGREISIAELVKLISSLSSCELKIKTDEQRIRPEASEVERLLCDNSKLKQATNWSPEVSLEEGLSRTIKWMAEQNFQTDVSKYHV